MAQIVITRLKDRAYRDLNYIAKKRDQKISELMQEVVVYYLENYNDYKIALTRLQKHTDIIIDKKELSRRLGWNK